MTYAQQYAPRQAQFDRCHGKTLAPRINAVELAMIAASVAMSLTLFWPLAWVM